MKTEKEASYGWDLIYLLLKSLGESLETQFMFLYVTTLIGNMFKGLLKPNNSHKQTNLSATPAHWIHMKTPTQITVHQNIK